MICITPSDCACVQVPFLRQVRQVRNVHALVYPRIRIGRIVRLDRVGGLRRLMYVFLDSVGLCLLHDGLSVGLFRRSEISWVKEGETSRPESNQRASECTARE